MRRRNKLINESKRLREKEVKRRNNRMWRKGVKVCVGNSLRVPA